MLVRVLLHRNAIDRVLAVGESLHREQEQKYDNAKLHCLPNVNVQRTNKE